MMIFRTILSFFTVAFLLTLFGKVSKVDLYHAYFKTIQDVEIRNSTGLERVFELPAMHQHTDQLIQQIRVVFQGFGFLYSSFSHFIPERSWIEVPDHYSGKKLIFRMFYQLSHPHYLP